MSEDSELYQAISRRRVSCSFVTQQIWDAIQSAVYQRQQPNLDRIARYMLRMHGVSEDEVQKHLANCVRDGLLRHFKRVGIKGKSSGVEQDGYTIPKELDPPRDGHDWYCFKCHTSGDVICCTSCHRVYHVSCLPSQETLPADDMKNNFTCTVCKACADEPASPFKPPKKTLNRLLVYTCARLKERLPLNWQERLIQPCPYLSTDRNSSRASMGSSTMAFLDEDQSWRAKFLCYNEMTVHIMERKAEEREYNSLAEFEADAATIVHNIVIYHGVLSVLADQARQMLRDCQYDLCEMQQCSDCYRRSNEKSNKNWFCMPCNPPHELVYAKQKGYPYWPAKVIKVENGMYDVRFFGAPHERAKLEHAHIRPITVDAAALGVKRTSAWNKACEELRRHQQMLALGKGSVRSDSSDDDEEPVLKKKKSVVKPTVKNIKAVVKEEKEDEDDESLSDESEETPEKTGSGLGRLSGRGSGRKSGGPSSSKTPKRRGRKPGNGGGRGRPGKRGSTPQQESGVDGPAPPLSLPPLPPPPPSADVELPALPPRDEKQDDSDVSSGDEDDASVVSSTSQPHPTSKEVGEEDLVSSSCTEPRSRSIAIQTPPRLMKDSKSKRNLKEAAELEKLRRDLEREKAQAVTTIKRQYEREIEQLRNDHAAELADLHEKQALLVAETKRKQWCYNCEAEAIYHCCWNTAYCSTECQQSHWHKEHKRLCRRKR